MILESTLWGLIAASSLLVGMAIAMYTTVSTRVVGWTLAFGAGALLSAITFELVVDALVDGSRALLASGMFIGAVVFVSGARIVDRTAGPRHGEESQAKGIVLGVLLDGIPESLTIGASIAVATTADVSTTLIVAVALSNLPEALGATSGLLAAGHSRQSLVRMWTGIVAMSGAAAALGALALAESPPSATALLSALTAGSVLAMLTDSMIPEAYRKGGQMAGLAVVTGFILSFLLA